MFSETVSRRRWEAFTNLPDYYGMLYTHNVCTDVNFLIDLCQFTLDEDENQVSSYESDPAEPRYSEAKREKIVPTNLVAE